MSTTSVRSNPRTALAAAASIGAFALLGAVAAGPAAAQGTAECDAMGDTLAAARSAYAQACPSLPRLDCDPVIGGWACASYRIGEYAPTWTSGASASDPFLPSAAPEAADTAPGVGECRWIDATLESARAGYARMCRLPRRDCDPVPEGWMCSSRQIGAGAPSEPVAPPAPTVPVPSTPPGPSTPSVPSEPSEPSAPPSVPSTPEPSTPPEPSAPSEPSTPPAPSEPAAPPSEPSTPSAPPEPSGPGSFEPPPSPGPQTPPPGASTYDGRFGEPARSWADSYSANGVCYASTNGDHGVLDLTVATPTGTATVREALRRIEQGPGISNADAVYNDVRCGRGPANDLGDEDADQCPGRVDQGRAGCATIGPDWRYVN